MALNPGKRAAIPSGVLVINKKTWAVGLDWNSASSAADARRLALTRGGKSAYTAVVIRAAKDGTYQFGLGNDVKGHKNGVPSLASAFCTKVPGSWFAAFRVDAENCYCIASRNGVIEPLTDKVVNDYQVRDLYDMVVPGLGAEYKVMAPAELDIEGSVERPLADVVPTLEVAGKIGPINRSAANRTMVVRSVMGLMAIGLTYYGYLWLQTPQGEVTPPQTLDVEPAPWWNKEYGVEAANLCIDAMGRLPIGGPGWTRVSSACQDGSASAIYTRDKPLNNGGAPIAWFRTMLKDGGWPVQGLSQIGATDKIAYSMSVPTAKDTWNQGSKPQPIATQVNQLAGRFDKAFLTSTTTSGDVKYFPTRTMTFHTPYSPREYLHMFDDLIGVTLTSISQTANGWDTSMTIGQADKLPQGMFINQKKPAPPRKFDGAFTRVYAQN